MFIWPIRELDSYQDYEFNREDNHEIFVFYNLFNVSRHNKTKQITLELIFIDYATFFYFVSYFCRI